MNPTTATTVRSSANGSVGGMPTTESTGNSSKCSRNERDATIDAGAVQQPSAWGHDTKACTTKATTKSSTKSQPKQSLRFPAIFHHFVEDMTRQHPDAVRWVGDGIYLNEDHPDLGRYLRDYFPSEYITVVP